MCRTTVEMQRIVIELQETRVQKNVHRAGRSSNGRILATS